MDMRIIEVPYDGAQVVLVEVDGEDFYQGGMLWRRSPAWTRCSPRGGSVRSAMNDVTMPTMHTTFDRISEGSPVPDSVGVTGHGEAAGFHGDRIQALQPHHIRTLDDWVQALRPYDDEAVPIAAEEVYQRYNTHLTGSAAHIRSGHIDAIPLTPGQDGIGSVCPGE